jgi:undecaprenyl-diphosphatase
MRSLQRLLKALGSYRKNLGKLYKALGVSMLLSIVYTLSLLAVSQSLHITLSLSEIFIVYSISLVTGTLTPTPGGLIGVEAGLVVGFTAYGVDNDLALAAALLYRLITYWLPIIPGFFAFRAVQKRFL